MKNLIFLTTLFIISCSSANEPLDSNSMGTLILDVNIVDAAGQNSKMEEVLKTKLTVTIFDKTDKAVKSWRDLSHLPDKISLALGTYYVIVESKDTIASEGNVFSYYAKTDLIQINGSHNQNIELTFKDHLSPAGFSALSF